MSEGDELLARSRRGDARATNLLFEGYFQRLLPLARCRISRRLARRFDAEDIVQSVFCRFFARPKEEWQRLDYEGPFRLLARMTVCRTLKQITYETADKRDPARELAADGGERPGYTDVAAPALSPDLAALFADQLEHFLAQLLAPDRRALELRLEGYSTPEIAHTLGTCDRQVRRMYVRIRAAADRAGLCPSAAP